MNKSETASRFRFELDKVQYESDSLIYLLYEVCIIEGMSRVVIPAIGLAHKIKKLFPRDK